MQEKLEQMFPDGQWGLGQRQWMVKDGTYFCAAADVTSGEIVLTALGDRLAGTFKKPVKEEAVVEQPSPAVFVSEDEDVPAPKKVVVKKTGLKA